MPTVYLHCGAPKTGTSYMQVLFAKYSEELRAQGIVYPYDEFVAGAKDGKITSGNGVKMANYLLPELPHKIADKTAFIDEFDHMLENGNGANFLFSSEFLVFPDTERTKRLVKVIEKNGYDAKVIYLVRDYANAARSAYSQKVKRAGEARCFEAFLKQWDPQYVHTINLITAAFGAESLSVFNYEEQKADLARLFFEIFLGCSINIEVKVVINRSLNDKELELLRVFNEFSGGSNAFSSTFVSDALMQNSTTESEDYTPRQSELKILHERFNQLIADINSVVLGRAVQISSGCHEAPEKAVLNDFERFTMAVLSKLVGMRQR